MKADRRRRPSTEHVMIEKIFPKNEHKIDRTLRVLLGLGLLGIALLGPKTPWGWLGLIPLVTGLAGRCPVYALFGVGTCPHEGTC